MFKKSAIIITLLTALLLPGCGEKKKRHTKRELIEKRLSEERPHKSKKINRLTYDEALEVYAYYKKQNKIYPLSETIERIIALANDHTVIEPMLHEVADLHYGQRDFKKAEEYYTLHAQMYPGGADIDYIQKQQIEASFRQIANPQRDQAKTKNTIKLATHFIATYPADNQYLERVQTILKECYFNLMESEINQVLFYINRYNLTLQPKALEAGWQRLADLNRDILPHIDDKRVRTAQETIRTMLDHDVKERTLENLEATIAPLQRIARQRFAQNIPAHRQPWRNRF